MRRVAKATVGLVVLIALVAFAATRLIDVDAWRGDLARTLSARLGLDVRIDGPLRLELGWRPEIVVSDVTVTPRGAPADAPLARLEAAAFEADLISSYRERRVVISQVRASGIAVSLVRDAEGVGNWQLIGGASRPARAPTGLAMLSLEGFVLEDGRVRYTTAVSDWSFELDIDRLDVRAPDDGPSLSFSTTGRVQGNDFSIRGTSVSDEVEAQGILGDRAHIALEVAARLGPLRLTADGTVDDPRGRAGADLRLTVGLDDLDELRQLVRLDDKIDLVGIGAVDVEAHLIGGDGRVRLDDVALRVEGTRTGRLEGHGRVGDAIRGADIDLALTVDSPDGADVMRRLRIPHPGVGRTRGTGAFRGAWPEVAFEDIEVRADHPLGARLDVRGRVARDRGKWAAGLDFAVDAARAGDVATIVEEVVASVRRGQEPIRLGRPDLVLHQIVMEIGPARVTGRVAGRDKTWAVDGVSARAGHAEVDWFRATGGIAALVPLPTGIAFDIEAGSDDLGPLIERAGVPVKGLERLRLGGRVTGDAEHMVLEDMQAIASTPDRITIGLSGDVPMRDTFVGTELVVAISARDLAVVGEAVDRVLPPVGPVEMSAEVVADGEALNGRNLMMGLGESRITGHFRAEPGERRPYVVATLGSERFRLRDLGLEPTPAAEGTPPTDPSWIDRALPFEDLLEMDGEWTLTMDRLVGREGLEASDVEVRARLRDGVLDVDHLRLVWEGGLLQSSLRIDARRLPAEVDWRLDGDGFSIERVLAQFVEERIADGTGQLVADLHSRGVTVRELGANLDGDVLFYGRDGGLTMRYSRALQLDIGSRAARRAARGELEAVQCLIVDASARAGRLTLETVLFDSEDKQVLGSGDVDLATEKVEVLLTPVLKEAIPGSVATAVRVSGRLDDPTITPAPLVTAAGAAQGLVDRALLPLTRILPGVGSAVDEARRAADRAIEGTGVELPVTGLWRPGIDVTCDKVLHTERIEALRSDDTVQPG